MTYSGELIDRLGRNYATVIGDLQSLMFRGVGEAQRTENVEVRKYLNHGVGRRLSILKRSIEKVFEIFPPDRQDKLSRDEVTSVQIFLHAL